MEAAVAAARTGDQAGISASRADQRLLLHRLPHCPRPSLCSHGLGWIRPSLSISFIAFSPKKIARTPSAIFPATTAAGEADVRTAAAERGARAVSSTPCARMAGHARRAGHQEGLSQS